MTPTLLFVHSPVLGPATWSSTADVLRSKGFRCDVPDTTAVASSGGPYYPKFAAAVAEAVDDDHVVVVGHSAAGPLLPAIADVLGGRVLAAIFADATLPHPGLSWFDAAPAPLRDQLRVMAEGGRLPPWHEWFPPGALDELLPDPSLRGTVTAEIPRLPLAYFEEPAPATTPAQRCAFLRFSTPTTTPPTTPSDSAGGWHAGTGTIFGCSPRPMRSRKSSHQRFPHCAPADGMLALWRL